MWAGGGGTPQVFVFESEFFFKFSERITLLLIKLSGWRRANSYINFCFCCCSKNTRFLNKLNFFLEPDLNPFKGVQVFFCTIYVFLRLGSHRFLENSFYFMTSILFLLYMFCLFFIYFLFFIIFIQFYFFIFYIPYFLSSFFCFTQKYFQFLLNRGIMSRKFEN